MRSHDDRQAAGAGARAGLIAAPPDHRYAARCPVSAGGSKNGYSPTRRSVVAHEKRRPTDRGEYRQAAVVLLSVTSRAFGLRVTYLLASVDEMIE
jgi:hypothetical protein